MLKGAETFVSKEMPVLEKCPGQGLTVTGAAWPLPVPAFCGTNNGQHFYIEVRAVLHFPALHCTALQVREGVVPLTVQLTVSTQAAGRYKWGLWLTQVDYHTQLSLDSFKLNDSELQSCIVFI